MPQVFTNSAELVAEVSRRYLEYRTYRDEGVVKTHIVPEPNSTMPEVTIDLPFRTYFIRPDCFRFEFRAKTAPWETLPESEWERYLTWSVGGVTKEWWTLRPHIRIHESVFDALGGAAGISRGSSMGVPSLLMPIPGSRSPLRWYGTSVLGAIEPIDGVPCYRLESETDPNRHRTLWIDAGELLLRRILEVTAFTEEFLAKQIADAREAMARAAPGGLVTPELKRRIQEYEPRFFGKFVSKATTDYQPIANKEIEQKEFEADLPPT